ncbi:hypothetical protein [Burkholderia sp. Ac-20365]|uniref:hypothetical protein n=1 Tax=Burkholderia sp. Ac-20365 TaxID=2703897 RepID=UPI00197C426C|nr:hypothetical protein [Burkholderia sp. Ac-20365]MBN3760879.1 hypothetical protein [Burkholderia sp. Ac-20365]
MNDAIKLPVEKIAAVLKEHGESCNPDRIGHYTTIDELVEKVRSSKNWERGEIFVCAIDAERFVLMKQIAPDSCEMLTLTHNGYHDVNTAYRFEQAELVGLVQQYAGVGTDVLEALFNDGLELQKIKEKAGESSSTSLYLMDCRLDLARTLIGLIWELPEYPELLSKARNIVVFNNESCSIKDHERDKHFRLDDEHDVPTVTG